LKLFSIKINKNKFTINFVISLKYSSIIEGVVKYIEYEYSATEPTTSTIEVVSFSDDFDAYNAGSGVAAVPTTSFVINKDVKGSILWQCRLYSSNIVTRSSDARKGGAVSYVIGNDGYSKIGFSVSTGLTEDIWVITLLGSKTVGNGYIQGTEFESYSYFMNILKKISDAHQLSFTAFAPPQWHNQRNNSDRMTIEEWQKQPLKYKYNASYGFDMNGQRKQSSYNVYNKPQISLNHFWTIDEKSSLSTALYVSIENGGSFLVEFFLPPLCSKSKQ